MSTTESKLREALEALVSAFMSHTRWNGDLPIEIVKARAALALPESSSAEPHPDTVLLKEVFDELDGGGSDGPRHCHSVAGMWDMDNGKKAGKPCKWCATWAKVRASVAQAEAAKGVAASRTLDEQIAAAQAECATWSPEKRGSMRLEGGDAS